MEIEKLKAKAYDMLVTIEQARAMLNQINQQIEVKKIEATSNDKPETKKV